MPNFTVDGRMKGLPDIQRAFMFELLIPDIGDWIQDDMVVRCKTAVIPSRGNTPIESVFGGMKQYYAGQPLFTSTLTVEIEEHEDQKALQSLYDWQQKIYDVNPNSPRGGAQQGGGKADITRDISLKMYKYNGDNMPKSVKFYNAFIENVDDAALGYATNESVKYNVTFRFDYWLLEDR